MSFLVPLVTALAMLPGDTVRPYVAFPESGLDDPAAYEGYATRVYRDARGDAFQVYLARRLGRVVQVWADAADESAGFSARDSAGQPAPLSWPSGEAVVTAVGHTRSVSYELDLGPAPVTLGLFLLGSMRVERDFQYAGRDSLPLDSAAFPEPELLGLVARLKRLERGERQRELALLRSRSVAELEGRLEPHETAKGGGVGWSARIDAVSFDGRSHMTLELAGRAPETEVALRGRALTVRSRAGRAVRLRVRVTTDAPALTPLSREAIFNAQFRRFVARVEADTAHPLTRRRLERELRGTELLSYDEKLMAGLPNFATYFGRDGLMTALLMQPVWAPAMPEHVIASVLRKLSPEGDVSHEEALGGEAIRENARLYNRLADQYHARLVTQDTTDARHELAQARRVLGDLAATRENYIMVDDDFQFPIVAARYLTDPRVPPERKRAFLGLEDRLARLIANLGFVARQAEPYARDPVAMNLVSFPRAPDGGWTSASWRDSRAGYGAGRFAMDVNVIWVPRALESVGTILDALARLGLAPQIPGEPLATYARDRAALERDVAVWQGSERLFRVALAAGEASARIAARLGAMPAGERAYWERVWRRVGVPRDTVAFLALALDSLGQPIPIVNTDPAILLLLDSLDATRVRALVAPSLTPYPVGLFVDGLGPFVANDAYAAPDVWHHFARDRYHSPTVVWGRDVNLLLAGLARQIALAPQGANLQPLHEAVERTVSAVERSGLRHAELWSYRIAGDTLVPMRYGTSSDVQLWSLTDLAVQYLLQPSRP